MSDEALARLATRLDHDFDDPRLLRRAVTHRSFAHEHRCASNERLEFLGDAVLQTSSTILLYDLFPEAPEGALSRYRAGLVNTQTLAELGRELGIGEVLRLGRGEESQGGRDKESILADTVEALLGAIYLDADFDCARAVVTVLLSSRLNALYTSVAAEGPDARIDPRSMLQEHTQRRFQETPIYETIAEEGPAHDPTFEVEVRLGDEVIGRGRGGSKRGAARAAARAALRSMAPGEEEATC